MDRQPLPKICWICGKAVSLETCAVDEHGMAVHENCYVAKLSLNGHRANLANSGPAENRMTRHRRIII
jgi:hypothetical protein